MNGLIDVGMPTQPLHWPVSAAKWATTSATPRRLNPTVASCC